MSFYTSKKAEQAAARRRLKLGWTEEQQMANTMIRRENAARRNAARLKSEKSFTPVTPCRNGHFSRYTSSNGCTKCHTTVERKIAQTAQHRKRTYGITDKQFDELLVKQDGRCAICENDLPARNKIHVDHCHKTGTVRGLLCARCNSGLGFFKENLQLFLKAEMYLLTAKVNKYKEYYNGRDQ